METGLLKDFEKHGLATQTKQAAALFARESRRVRLRSGELHKEFVRRAQEVLKTEVPPAVKAGETGARGAQSLTAAADGKEAEADAKQVAELAERAQATVDRGMNKLTNVASRQARDAFAAALKDAMDSGKVKQLRQLMEQTQRSMREVHWLASAENDRHVAPSAGGDKDAPSAGSEKGSPSAGGESGGGRYEKTRKLAARDGTPALAVDALAADDVVRRERQKQFARCPILLVPTQTVKTAALEKDANAEVKPPYQPPFKTKVFAVAPLVTKNRIRVDGDLSDWAGIRTVPFRGVKEGQERPAVRVAWRLEGLYVAISAANPDNKITKADIGAYWHGDASEIWLDMPNLKRGNRAASKGGTHQFALFPFGWRDESLYGLEYGVHNGKGFEFVKYVKAADLGMAARQVDKGWDLEVFFPAGRLAKPAPQLGRFIGMDVSIAHGKGISYWAGGFASSWNCPAAWGDVLLGGSDARIHVRTDSESKWDQPEPILEIGRQLQVQVHDADMDRDPKAPDKLRVTVTADSGDKEILVVEETAADSGVFEGRIATILTIGAATADVLECYEGDRLRVQYTDRMRTTGPSREVVTAKVRTAIGVVAAGQK